MSEEIILKGSDYTKFSELVDNLVATVASFAAKEFKDFDKAEEKTGEEYQKEKQIIYTTILGALVQSAAVLLAPYVFEAVNLCNYSFDGVTSSILDVMKINYLKQAHKEHKEHLCGQYSKIWKGFMEENG